MVLYNKIIKLVERLDLLIDQRARGVTIVEQDYPSEKISTSDYNARKGRLTTVNNKFNSDWISTLKELQVLCAGVRKVQPHLNALNMTHFNSTQTFPDFLVFGRLKLRYENFERFLPRVISFPVKSPIRLNDSEKSDKLIRQFVLRMIHSLPAGHLEIHVIDPMKLGKSVESFLPLFSLQKLFPDGKALTRADEIENCLRIQTDYIETLLRDKFRGKASDWRRYNEANKEHPLPYRLLLLFGLPEQLTDKSLWYLRRIIEHGCSCGVLPIFTQNEEKLSEKKFSEFMETHEKYAIDHNCLTSDSLKTVDFKHLSLVSEAEFGPDDNSLSSLIDLIEIEYEKRTAFSGQIEQLWHDGELWTSASDHVLEVPIGWNTEGYEIFFTLGGVNTEHHALLGGRSGRGKSNLLHVIIHSLCHFYSPDELEVYLLDFKEATEFNVYASPPLPQARLVAVESDTEYAVSVLEWLEKEQKKRASLFKKLSVKDYYEYRDLGKDELPRVLLIIDEFQILFEGDSANAAASERLLNVLLRQGRAFGIHLLLATQTLKGIQSLSMGQLISQIGCRIVLECTQEDSAMILGSNNWAAAELNSPPEGIINNSNGAKSANIKFLIPLAEPTKCKQHLEILANRSTANRTVVFSGANLPPLPDMEWFSKQNSSLNALIMGEELNFRSDTFSIQLSKNNLANILVAGYDHRIKEGLLTSILFSLCTASVIDEIVLLTNDVQETRTLYNKILDTDIVVTSSTNEYDYSTVLDELDSTCRVLVIENLNSAKSLHSSSIGYGRTGTDSTTLPSEHIKQILELGPSKGTFVIAFSDNIKRSSSLCRDLLSFLDLRIGYSMNEDDAGSLVTGSIGKLRGLKKRNKAIFSDRRTGATNWFRPFVLQETASDSIGDNYEW